MYLFRGVDYLTVLYYSVVCRCFLCLTVAITVIVTAVIFSPEKRESRKKKRKEKLTETYEPSLQEVRLRRDSEGDFGISPHSPSEPPEPEQLIEALQVNTVCCYGLVLTFFYYQV